MRLGTKERPGRTKTWSVPDSSCSGHKEKGPRERAFPSSSSSSAKRLLQCGFDGALPREQQGALALSAIRVATSLMPVVFLLLAVWVARGYPLDRAAHERILQAIARRAALGASSGG